jgi:uncharacterized protein (UPF0276 family)
VWCVCVCAQRGLDRHADSQERHEGEREREGPPSGESAHLDRHGDARHDRITQLYNVNIIYHRIYITYIERERTLTGTATPATTDTVQMIASAICVRLRICIYVIGYI